MRLAFIDNPIDRLTTDPDTPLCVPNGNASALCNQLRRRALPHRTMRIGRDVWIVTPERHDAATQAAQHATLASLSQETNQ